MGQCVYAFSILGVKLRDFHGSLNEQAMLGTILGGAQGQDTGGYYFRATLTMTQWRRARSRSSLLGGTTSSAGSKGKTRPGDCLEA
jgi:hypothetical protein